MFTYGCIFDLMLIRQKRGKMANILYLLKKGRIERKQEKKRNALVTTAAVSVLVISCLIITL